ncbi:MAG TPA: glutamyl-tRNA reductase [Dermatophilaceae bacterium]|nr:glutamyl-tRNA reductase [Dermatophilaceae bacterium]
MSVLVVGLSHHSAPLALLERAALTPEAAAALGRRLAGDECLDGAAVLATCNRIEVYAGAATFHGALSAVTAALADATGMPRGELTEHLYVHYEERAVAHVFGVAAGLDSMAVGETQILGQLRDAHRTAHRDGTLDEELGALLQRALRVGKRVHAETDIDAASRSLVDAGLEAAAEWVGPLEAARVLVVGAGGMSALAATTVARSGPAELVIVNRTTARAQRLAARVGGRVVAWPHRGEALVEADVVVCSTGAAGHVVDRAQVEAVLAARTGRRQAYVDLALPRDVDPGVAEIPGVRLVDLTTVGDRLAAGAVPGVAQVRDLVTAEVAEHVAARATRRVAPTVAALRARAESVLAAELDRLDARAPGLDEHSRAEVHQAMRRVVDKLLHAPTVRVKVLAAQADSPGDYEAALRELFGLDEHDIAALSVSPYLPDERSER